MTRRRGRGGVLLPLILIVGGLLFFLSNLGILGPDLWETAFRFWPILLIAVGLDMIVGRASLGGAISTLVMIVALFAIGFVAFHLFAPDPWISEDHSVAVTRSDAAEAHISLECGGCTIRAGSTSDPATLIAGTITVRLDERLSQSVRLKDHAMIYVLQSGAAFWLPFGGTGEKLLWDLALTNAIPLSLTVFTDGAVDLDLREVSVQSVDVTAEVGPATIALSTVSSAVYYVLGEDFAFRVPEGVGVWIDRANLRSADAPADYVLTESALLSPDYENALITAEIVLRPGTGSVLIEPVEPRR